MRWLTLLFATGLILFNIPRAAAQSAGALYIELHLGGDTYNDLDSSGSMWVEENGTTWRSTFDFRHWIHLASSETSVIEDSGDRHESLVLVVDDRRVGTGLTPNCYRSRITCTARPNGTNTVLDQAVGTAQRCVSPPPDPNETCNQSCWTACHNGQCPPQEDGQECTPYCSPLVLDMGAEGIPTSAADDPVQFDIDANGTIDTVAWLARETEDAFLWRDVARNNRVDDGSELFGMGMTLPGGRRAANGFEALAAYDAPVNGGNGDRLISSADRIWHRLRLWRDQNHNGTSEAHELTPIEASCVAALSLKWVPTVSIDAAGNQVRMASTYDCQPERSENELTPRPLVDLFFRVFR
jgi:hypothetical protein